MSRSLGPCVRRPPLARVKVRPRPEDVLLRQQRRDRRAVAQHAGFRRREQQAAEPRMHRQRQAACRPTSVILPSRLRRRRAEHLQQLARRMRSRARPAARTSRTSAGRCGPTRATRAPCRTDRRAAPPAIRTARAICPRSPTRAGCTAPAACGRRGRRWVALARLMRLSSSRSRPRCGSKPATRARPLSITVVTPSIVSDVSAMFVATTIFRLLVSGSQRGELLVAAQAAVQREEQIVAAARGSIASIVR